MRNDLGIGSRPEIRPGGGVTRSDFGTGNRAGLGNRTTTPGTAGRFSGDRTGGRSTANLPGLGGGRAGAAGAGQRFEGNRVGGNRGTISERHNELSGRFNDLQTHWNDRGWNAGHWNGPNGGSVNHVGFWGPNGYWGHTGAWGPNGGHWGRSTGITPYGAWGHSGGWGPNGAVWGRGFGVGAYGGYRYGGFIGPAGHWSRNWGGWYRGFGPAWGYGRWNYLWNRYPVAMAFGATMWGLNAVAWTFGVGNYYNPYCDGPVYVDNQQVVSYTQPVVGDPAYDANAEQALATADDNSDAPAPTPGSDAEVAPSTPDDALTQTFNDARNAFYQENFDQALSLTDQALKSAPRDAAINEFRSLCLFALGRYREAAANIHAVLAAGPGWDWTTMISLYSNKATYTAQLRQLESAVKANPKAADVRFLLAYHYLTCDYKDAAVALLKTVTELQPKDVLAADLVKMYTPAPDSAEGASTASTATPDAPAPDLEKPAYPLEKLQGDWVARDDRGEFALHLGKDDAFTWKFTREGKPQSVKGAYVIRGKNLVMQPDTGGTMLSEITLQNDQTLLFTPIGESQKLTFTRSQN